jgi:hypothetical protein
MRRASSSRASAPRRTTREICFAIPNRGRRFPACPTSCVPKENSSASQLNTVRHANEPIRSHKTRCRECETSQVKSPNSVIRTRSNSLKTNTGEMLKSPKNQKTRFSLPPAPWRTDSRFFRLLSPRAATLPLGSFQITSRRSLICISHSPLATRHCSVNWSRPLLTGSALQTEFGLTYRKQTTEKILTGARTHIKETRSGQHSDASPLGFPK